MKSLAVTLAGLVPLTRTRTDGGTLSRTSLVSQELKMAVVPTPNATQPTAPLCGVWLSLPMITWPGQGVPFQHLGVADGLGALDDRMLRRRAGQFAVELDALLLGKFLLLLLQLQRHVEQTLRLPGVGHGQFEEGQVVAEEEDRLRVDDLLVRADIVAPEDGGHRGHVLVAEADVGADEALVARLDVWHADPVAGEVGHPVAGEDLFGERHRPLRRGHVRHPHLALQPGHVVLEEPAMLDDAAGDAPLPVGEDGERESAPRGAPGRAPRNRCS